MSNNKRPAWVNAIAFVGLAAAMTVVIHSLVTGQGIHSLALLTGLFLVLMILSERKGRTWRGLPVIAFLGAAVAFSVLMHGRITGQDMDVVALGGGLFLVLYGLIHVFFFRSGYKE